MSRLRRRVRSPPAARFPQSTYQDARKSVGLSYARAFGAHLPTVTLEYAKENDYTARSIAISDAWTLMGGRATLHYGIAISRDIVSPVKNPVTNPTGADLNYPKNQNGYSLGWTWVFGERDLADVSVSLMNLSGDLTDPYKVVPVGPLDSQQNLPEERPSTRSRKAVVAKYSHFFLWGASVNVLYRFYDDDWSITGQHAGCDVQPEIRSGLDRVARDPVLYTDRRVLLGQRVSRLADVHVGRLSAVPVFQLHGWTEGHAPSLTTRSAPISGPTVLSQYSNDPIHLIPATGGARGTTVSAANVNVLTVTFGLTWIY